MKITNRILQNYRGSIKAIKTLQFWWWALSKVIVWLQQHVIECGENKLDSSGEPWPAHMFFELITDERYSHNILSLCTLRALLLPTSHFFQKCLPVLQNGISVRSIAPAWIQRCGATDQKPPCNTVLQVKVAGFSGFFLERPIWKSETSLRYPKSVAGPVQAGLVSIMLCSEAIIWYDTRRGSSGVHALFLILEFKSIRETRLPFFKDIIRNAAGQ